MMPHAMPAVKECPGLPGDPWKFAGRGVVFATQGAGTCRGALTARRNEAGLSYSPAASDWSIASPNCRSKRSA